MLQTGAQRVQHQTFAAHAERQRQVECAGWRVIKIPALRLDMPRAPSPDQLNVWTDFAEIKARPVIDVVASRPRSTPDVRNDLRIQAKHLLSAANAI